MTFSVINDTNSSKLIANTPNTADAAQQFAELVKTSTSEAGSPESTEDHTDVATDPLSSNDPQTNRGYNAALKVLNGNLTPLSQIAREDIPNISLALMPNISLVLVPIIKDHNNDPLWLSGFLQGLGPERIARVLFSPSRRVPRDMVEALARAIVVASPFLPPSFWQTLSRSADAGSTTASVRLNAVLRLLKQGQKDELIALYPSNFSSTDLVQAMKNRSNDTLWLSRLFQKLGPERMARVFLSPSQYVPPDAIKVLAQAFAAVASRPIKEAPPYVPSSFWLALGQSVGTGRPTGLVRLNAVLHRLEPHQRDDLIMEVGKGYMLSAARQQGDQKRITYAMAADAFSLVALDNPFGRTMVMDYLEGKQQADQSFLHDFTSEAVRGMAALADPDQARAGPDRLYNPVIIRGVSPLMIALNAESAGSAGNQMALKMFFGATDVLLGPSNDPNVSEETKVMGRLIQGEEAIGSHPVVDVYGCPLLDGNGPLQENLGIRTALISILTDEPTTILRHWAGNNSTGSLPHLSEVNFLKFVIFALSPLGNSNVAGRNLNALIGIAKRFVTYSLKPTGDRAITDLLGKTEPRISAANIAGRIFGSIAFEGNLSASAIKQSALVKSQADQFKVRIFYDWLGLILDFFGLGTLPRAFKFGGEKLGKIAEWSNHFRTGVGSLISLPRGYTYLRSNTALAEGQALAALPEEDRKLIKDAARQAVKQNFSVSNIMATIEETYSHNKLDAYKRELDNAFDMAGGTKVWFVGSPYISALNGGDFGSKIPSLSEWAVLPSIW
jgi:hypothetical protein